MEASTIGEGHAWIPGVDGVNYPMTPWSSEVREALESLYEPRKTVVDSVQGVDA